MAFSCICTVSVEWYSSCLKNLSYLCPKAVPSHHQPSPVRTHHQGTAPQVKTLGLCSITPVRKSLPPQIMRKTSQSQCRPELLTPVSILGQQHYSKSLLWLPFLLVLSLGVTKTWLLLAAEQRVKMVAHWN